MMLGLLRVDEGAQEQPVIVGDAEQGQEAGGVDAANNTAAVKIHPEAERM
jgi:hypothetical protein